QVVGKRAMQVGDGQRQMANHVGFGSLGSNAVGATVTRTFTVNNLGTANLTLGPTINVPAGFSLVSGFGSTTVAPGGSTTFVVGLNTTAPASYSGQVSFADNDSNANPFTFTISGQVVGGP